MHFEAPGSKYPCQDFEMWLVLQHLERSHDDELHLSATPCMRRVGRCCAICDISIRPDSVAQISPMALRCGVRAQHSRRHHTPNLVTANGRPSSMTRREPMQTVTKLLLLAMFAFAARYTPQNALQSTTGTDEAKQRLEAGHQYMLDARRLLSEFMRLQRVFRDRASSDSLIPVNMADTVYEDSRPSICQAQIGRAHV